jgi:hypothetical protein
VSDLVHSLGGQTVELELPGRLSVRYDLVTASAEFGAREQTARRVVAAALLLCWAGAARKGAPVYGGDVLGYGGDAIDFLLAKGATIDQIVRAGVAAMQLVKESMVSVSEVKEQLGNSDGSRTSGSSSGSSAGTG